MAEKNFRMSPGQNRRSQKKDTFGDIDVGENNGDRDIARMES